MPLYLRLLALIFVFLPTLALAHAEEGVAGGFVTGVLHPLVGFDHLVAMVAVGLWGAQLRAPAIWLLPVTFPMVMAAGALLGVAGMPLPGVEVGIACSAVVLGIMVAFDIRPKLWIATAIVGAFAIFHGHAHGTEVPNAVNPLAYGVGFVVSTGCLHLAGILIGLLIRWPAGVQVVRASGGLVAIVGAFSLVSAAGLLT